VAFTASIVRTYCVFSLILYPIENSKIIQSSTVSNEAIDTVSLVANADPVGTELVPNVPECA